MSVIPGTIVPAPLVIVYEGEQVADGVGVDVGVAVAVGVEVAVAVGVKVAVGVGVAPPGQLYLTFNPLVSEGVRHEKVVAHPPSPRCWTPLISELPSSTVTP